MGALTEKLPQNEKTSFLRLFGRADGGAKLESEVLRALREFEEHPELLPAHLKPPLEFVAVLKAKVSIYTARK